MKQIDTIVVGGGQAGLAMSYSLLQQRRRHLVLEQAGQAGNVWRNSRWDSFMLNTPNWTVRLPGMPYQGNDPDGFLPRNDIVAYFEQYIERFSLPVQFGECVISVEPLLDHKGYRVTTDREIYTAANVVIATGLFQRPKIPEFSRNLDSSLTQLHSSQYRNPGALPPGAVLVVGSAQSGCQIAEELYQSGRTVYLCVGSAGRLPRRYRGKDIVEWMQLDGFMDRTLDKLPSPQARFAGNPQVSGTAGGHSINLYQFARDGVRLLGRITDGRDQRISLALDLKENLAKADQFEADMLKVIDDFVEENRLDAPKETLPQLREGLSIEEVNELDLKSAGIHTVLWAMGYTYDFSLVKLPITGGDGYPIQQRGVTQYPGLYFVGLHWLYKFKSGLLLGVGEDAAYIAEQIANRQH